MTTSSSGPGRDVGDQFDIDVVLHLRSFVFIIPGIHRISHGDSICIQPAHDRIGYRSRVVNVPKIGLAGTRFGRKVFAAVVFCGLLLLVADLEQIHFRLGEFGRHPNIHSLLVSAVVIAAVLRVHAHAHDTGLAGRAPLRFGGASPGMRHAFRSRRQNGVHEPGGSGKHRGGFIVYNAVGTVVKAEVRSGSRLGNRTADCGSGGTI
mmetsp:Transcript_18276/g.38380  ORF Transcript_18276/g.38380 Transcript_18276/m.38380 type:complete len:206 (+) Transcript_18276:1807-2424(+)